MTLCRRSRSERAAAAFGAETEGVVPMEAMGEAYSRLANSRSVGGAVRAAARSAPGPAVKCSDMLHAVLPLAYRVIGQTQHESPQGQRYHLHAAERALLLG